MPKCPNCQMDTPVRIPECAHCREALYWLDRGDSPRPIAMFHRVCRYDDCGAPVAATAEICTRCNARVPSTGWPVDPLVREKLGNRYRLWGVLGSGGFGRVYLALDHDDVPCVVKILLPELGR